MGNRQVLGTFMIMGVILIILGIVLIVTHEEKTVSHPSTYESTSGDVEPKHVRERLNKSTDTFNQTADGVMLKLKQFEEKNTPDR